MGSQSFHILSPAMAAEIRALVEAILEERAPAAQPGNEPYLTVKHAAKQSGIPEQTIRKWLSQKRIRSYRAGRCIRVKLSEILKEQD
ncbi:MAG: Helix-turn-helix domain [Blastocatellia bacterium]|jgi:excisionase family DNA binding protein|nr:Helix-turn-helix domain [Blastocatellia bacterium]